MGRVRLELILDWSREKRKSAAPVIGDSSNWDQPKDNNHGGIGGRGRGRRQPDTWTMMK